MGLNMGLVYVRGAEVEDLAAVGLVPTGERMSADVASTAQDADLIVARPVGDWLLLVGPELLLGFEDEMLARTLDRQVVAAMLGSTGDTFSFARSDPDGTRRHVVDSAGERAVDEGPPLPEEARIEQLTEDTIQDLAFEVTGVNVWESFTEGDWQVLSSGREGRGQEGSGDVAQTRPQAPAPPVEPTRGLTGQPRKGFFARLFDR